MSPGRQTVRPFGSLAKVSGKWPSAKGANEPQLNLALTGQIRGEASYQPTLRKLDAGRRERGEDVTFRVFFWPEPSNSYDSNAVAVYVSGLGVIGYVPREHAAEIQSSVLKLWNHHQIASCDAKLFGGSPGKPTLGAWLSLDAEALVGHRYG